MSELHETGTSTHMTEAAQASVHSWEDLHALCTQALTALGADTATSEALSGATVDAERRGRSAVGVAHLFDYIAALQSGRMNGSPTPIIDRRRPAVLVVDADEGTAQGAYQLVRSEFLDAIEHSGLAILGIHNSFTSGELGYYSADIAAQGYVTLAGTNSPALMAAFDAKISVTGTNPFSFAIPASPLPRVIDQASSEIAWVSIRDAADRGESIPLGWALDAEGQPTTSAEAALEGTLLPFGGVKGANIALMIESLGALVGGNFSIDAPSHYQGHKSPSIGLWIIAIDPAAFDPNFVSRSDAHFTRMIEFLGHDFGRRRAPLDAPEVAQELIDRLAHFTQS